MNHRTGQEFKERRHVSSPLNACPVNPSLGSILSSQVTRDYLVLGTVWATTKGNWTNTRHRIVITRCELYNWLDLMAAAPPPCIVRWFVSFWFSISNWDLRMLTICIVSRCAEKKFSICERHRKRIVFVGINWWRLLSTKKRSAKFRYESLKSVMSSEPSVWWNKYSRGAWDGEGGTD